MSPEEFIQHHGVKGMKWGVRRYQPYPKGSKKKGKFLDKTKKKISEGRPGQEVRSVKRAMEVSKIKNNMDNMTTQDIKSHGKRIQSENEMKRLAKTQKEKKDFRNRGNMSDQELNRKLDRLRAKDILRQNANKANKGYVAAGKLMVDILID